METAKLEAYNMAQAIRQWFMQHAADMMIGLLSFILILCIGYFVIAIICSITQRFLARHSRVSAILEEFLLNVLHKVLWMLLIMLALPTLGVNVGPLVAGLGVSGFIVGFAFQETLGNMASGLMLLLNEPFQKGDLIEAGGVLGTVHEMNIMATTLITVDNKSVMIPNKAIWGSSITNYVTLGTRRVDMTMGISYGSDIAKAKEVAMKVLQDCPLVLKDPAPVVEVSEMADSSVNFVVRPWTKAENYWDVYWHVNHALKEALDANGLEIPFPQMDIHQR